MTSPYAAGRSVPTEEPLATPPTKCPTCDDLGWVVDHDEECYWTGDCVGCGGRQVPCDDPRGHADRCTHCSAGLVWDPTRDGNVADCHHCTGGWIYRASHPTPGEKT